MKIIYSLNIDIVQKVTQNYVDDLSAIQSDPFLLVLYGDICKLMCEITNSRCVQIKSKIIQW